MKTKRYTKKQITEAIAYWKRQLKKMDENLESQESIDLSDNEQAWYSITGGLESFMRKIPRFAGDKDFRRHSQKKEFDSLPPTRQGPITYDEDNYDIMEKFFKQPLSEGSSFTIPFCVRFEGWWYGGFRGSWEEPPEAAGPSFYENVDEIGFAFNDGDFKDRKIEDAFASIGLEASIDDSDEEYGGLEIDDIQDYDGYGRRPSRDEEEITGTSRFPVSFKIIDFDKFKSWLSTCNIR